MSRQFDVVVEKEFERFFVATALPTRLPIRNLNR